MNSKYSSEIEGEIKELINKGWSDFPSMEFGIRISVQLQDSEVSFPKIAYNVETGNHDSSGVWAKWRARHILRELRQYGHKLLWEVGSGHGNVAIPLHKNNISVIGIEPLLNGAVITANNGIRTYLGTLESLKLPQDSVSAIGVFDVLEHLENPEALLFEIYRVLKPGGLLLITVPAHQWLFSDFDKAIGHYRRYSKKVLYRSLTKAGFRNSKIEFLYSVFVLPAFLLRKLPSFFGRDRNSRETIIASDNQNKIINFFEPILILFLYFERLIPFPFGLSLFSVSQK